MSVDRAVDRPFLSVNRSVDRVQQKVGHASRSPLSLLRSTGRSCARFARQSTGRSVGHCYGLHLDWLLAPGRPVTVLACIWTGFSLLLNSNLCTISSDELKNSTIKCLSPLSLQTQVLVCTEPICKLSKRILKIDVFLFQSLQNIIHSHQFL